MSLKSAMISVIVFAGVFALAGGAIGGALGWLAPDFYKQMFTLQPGVDVIQLGIGLGITQGLVGGLVVGVLLVVVMAWKQTRNADK